MYKATKNELFYAANALFFRYPTLFDVMFFRLVSLAAMLQERLLGEKVVDVHPISMFLSRKVALGCLGLIGITQAVALAVAQAIAQAVTQAIAQNGGCFLSH